jgi:hypothetical protein
MDEIGLHLPDAGVDHRIVGAPTLFYHVSWT